MLRELKVSLKMNIFKILIQPKLVVQQFLGFYKKVAFWFQNLHGNPTN